MRRHPLENRVPPPIVAALAAALAWLAARTLPELGLPAPGTGLRAAALPIGLAGVAVAAAGLRSFRRAATTVDPLHPERASALVVDGIYRRTRNPMYLGMALVLLGWAAWLGNLAALVGPVAFVAWTNRWQVPPEERVLAERFGDAYASYAGRVRRWL